MDRTEIASIVERTGVLVAGHYVFADVGARLREVLAEHAAAGRYAAAGDLAGLGDLVTADLRSVNGDLHLQLKHHPEPIPDLPDEAAQEEMFRRQAARSMGGVARVERLAGNVALLDLSPVLFPVAMVGDLLAAAMQLVARADALLIDLRGNRGGDPQTVALVCGYLFDEPVHLVTMEARDAAPTQSWSLPWVPGLRFGGSKPVYLLTAAATYSGGEELAYDLQQRGRATVVGERTRGGAHPRTGFRVHPHLEVTVPTRRGVSPVTGTNWEGVGVVPDVEVPAAEAFDVAYGRALVDAGAPAGLRSSA